MNTTSFGRSCCSAVSSVARHTSSANAQGPNALVVLSSTCSLPASRTATQRPVGSSVSSAALKSVPFVYILLSARRTTFATLARAFALSLSTTTCISAPSAVSAWSMRPVLYLVRLHTVYGGAVAQHCKNNM